MEYQQAKVAIQEALPGLSKLTLRDIFAMHAPEPREDDVRMQCEYDRQRNPYNEGPPKPPLRSVEEVRADLRYRYADSMLKARSKSYDSTR